MDKKLVGLEKSNVRFDRRGEGGWGKNKFNNAFPIALLTYMHSRGLDLPYIRAISHSGIASIERTRISIPDVFGGNPEECFYEFEGIFPGFHPYVHGIPNKSDVIVRRGSSHGEALRALEIKLTVVPDQTTLRSPREAQASEFVTRPLMIELLATNICMAYGPSGRPRLNSILLEGLGNPNNWNWASESEMYPRLGLIRSAIEHVLCDTDVSQTPMVLQPIWRTIGDSTRLDFECFDAFVWSDFGLALLYLQATIRNIEVSGTPVSISRETRSAVWLVKMLWDYSTAGQLTMSEVKNAIAYGKQQDKAGAFSGKVMLDYLMGPELARPRVKRDELPLIVLNGGEEYLNPERRLDASLYFETIIAKLTS